MTTTTAILPMSYSVFPNVKATSVERIDGSWDELARMLESPAEHSRKSQCPLLKLATFGDELSPQGSLRTDRNMLAIHGVEGDYDRGVVSPEEAARRLKEANVEAIVYTTASHTAERPRWRALAPLSRSYAPCERERLVELLNGGLGGILNDESFTQSQSYFYGRVSGVEYHFYHTHGRPLDELDLVLPSIGKSHTAARNDVDLFAGVEIRASDEELIRQICTGENYHNALLILSARYRHREMKQTPIIDTLQGFMLAHRNDSLRWQERFADIPRMVRGAFQKWEQEEAQITFCLLTSDDLEKRPPVEWRVKGVFPKKGLAAIYGPPGSGKGFLVIDMAMAISSGSDWFNHRAKACPVIYCALEGEEGIPQRVAAYRVKHGHVGTDIRFLMQPFNLLKPEQVASLAKAIRDARGSDGVTILDTLNRATPGSDENDSKDMGLIIAAAKDLQSHVGGLVILVHHTGKDITKGLRGHSSLVAALDGAMELVRGADHRAWVITKSKDGRDGNSHGFRLQEVELGHDDDGDPISSCVIVPEAGTVDQVKKVKTPKGANQKIAYRTVQELLRSDTSLDDEKWPKSAPLGCPCIELEEVIVKVRDRLSCAPDQRTRSARNAVNALVATGLLGLEDGWLWLP